MRQKIHILGITFLLLSFFMAPISLAEEIPSPTPTDILKANIPVRNPDVPDINLLARRAILYDVDSQSVLFEKYSHMKVPVASTTKIMTAIVVLENYDLARVIKVPRKAARAIPTKMWLKVHENITVENLLWGLMLPSGNDAAYALAGLASPTNINDYKPFVAKMNAKARALGLNETSFYDSAGLNSRSKSSAHDLAKLTAYAMEKPAFVKMVKTYRKKVCSVNRKQCHYLTNNNPLLNSRHKYYMASAVGTKTGFTYEAGQCLVTATNYKGHLIIGVILKTNKRRVYEAARLSKNLQVWGRKAYTWPS